MSARDVRPIGSKCTSECRTPVGNHAHCSVCHRTLAAIGDFDRHRRDGWCLDLADLGLVERDGLWASPERHVANDRNAERLAEMRFQGLLASVDGRTGSGVESDTPAGILGGPGVVAR